MTMTWVTFDAALAGHRDASEALDALTSSSMADVQAMLDAIGAGEARLLLAEVREADPQERRSKLVAVLDIIDRHLPESSLVIKKGLFGRRSGWAGGLPPDGDLVRSALLASLIDSELGGDPERLRARVAMAATGLEGAFAADMNGLSKKDRGAETSAARGVLQTVLQVMLNDLQSRRGG